MKPDAPPLATVRRKTSAAAIKGDDRPLSITVDDKGRIFLQETEVSVDELVPRLRAITAAKSDTRIFIRADKTIAYGRVMDVMGTLGAAGFEKVALVSERTEQAPARR